MTMSAGAPDTTRAFMTATAQKVGGRLGEAITRLLAEHEPFRTYVFSLFADRMTELMQLVEAVAFQRLDQRLAALLLGAVLTWALRCTDQLPAPAPSPAGRWDFRPKCSSWRPAPMNSR